ncbi:MAG: VOC family protein [Nanoarchaeota archaeon]|nr:VOC family protein [Nanoarchaeota archaeon]
MRNIAYLSLFLLVLIVSIAALGQAGRKPVMQMGVVTLNVRNLDSEMRFYSDVLSLDVLEETQETALLGKGKPLIRLVSRQDLQAPKDEDNGLYHVALLYSSRPHLARTLYNAIMKSEDSYSGSANHTVSEAFYFTDPEGNGIELYFDIDKSMWQWANGSVRMETGRLDAVDYIKKNIGSETGNVSVRHVHLKGADIAAAKAFYQEVLGFDITSESGSAVFFASGGDHHNLAVNTWISKGSPPRRETLGLGSFEIILSEKDLKKVAARLDEKKVAYGAQDKEVYLSDPFGSKILLRVGP